MPLAGTKQQHISEPATLASPSRALPITPTAVLSDFEQICVALPVSGALIAVGAVCTAGEHEGQWQTARGEEASNGRPCLIYRP